MSNKMHVSGVPAKVTEVVVLLCQDYKARIQKREAPEGYTVGNIIEEALLVCEVGIRKEMFDDICMLRGYWCSPINYMIGKDQYYARKRKVIKNIATALHLI